MDATSPMPSDSPSTLTGPIAAGLFSWVAISLGFLGLKMLMQERPEFVGQPMRITQAELIQESPRVLSRKVTDDISVIKSAQPESSEITFAMTARRDYRGLRTIRDMAGEFRGEFVLTNADDEASFVLFKCPHPKTENADAQNLLAGELKMQAPAEGMQENTKDGWLWSGTIEAHRSARIAVSYQVGSLKGVSYRMGPQEGGQVKQLRVVFQRKDLGSMRFESGAGTRRPAEDTVVWERKDFLAPDFFSAEIEESRNLFGSLFRLLGIGPVICALFLLSVCAVLLTRQTLTALQVFTIAAGYAFYFPLILYLSANFAFLWALLLALAVPGLLLMNYARWLVGGRRGLIGAGIFLLLYQVFPTLAAFAGWNRGTVLLGLGVITLAVLINLQNRSLRKRAASAAVLFLATLAPWNADSAEVQVILPADLASKLASRTDGTNPIVAYEPAEYQVFQEETYFRVEARLPFQVVRAGDVPIPLFGLPVFLQTSQVESPEPEFARLVVLSNRPALFAARAGAGALKFTYRAPLESRAGKKRAQIPLALGWPGNVRLESARADVEFLSGTVWSRTNLDKLTVYEAGVAGDDSLTLEWSERPETADKPAPGGKEFYGIGLTRAQNLTIINSDSSCTHFAEFEIPVSQSDDFRMTLPAKARLISVSVNGIEVVSPQLEGQRCRLRLPAREAQQTAHHVSFRIAYPPMRLGFLGVIELSLPELVLTAGTLEWVVALPNGFETQVISSGLEIQKSTPELGRFGDYGRILKSHANIFLAKDLAPPAPVNLSLRYRQSIPGL